MLKWISSHQASCQQPFLVWKPKIRMSSMLLDSNITGGHGKLMALPLAAGAACLSTFFTC